jgi:hypothetical protein
MSNLIWRDGKEGAAMEEYTFAEGVRPCGWGLNVCNKPATVKVSYVRPTREVYEIRWFCDRHVGWAQALDRSLISSVERIKNPTSENPNGGAEEVMPHRGRRRT